MGRAWFVLVPTWNNGVVCRLSQSCHIASTEGREEGRKEWTDASTKRGCRQAGPNANGFCSCAEEAEAHIRSGTERLPWDPDLRFHGRVSLPTLNCSNPALAPHLLFYTHRI